LRARLSPVRFESKNREIPPISCNFKSHPGGFLCTADLLVALPGREKCLSCCISETLLYSRCSLQAENARTCFQPDPWSRGLYWTNWTNG
jgi:hypothetical protein